MKTKPEVIRSTDLAAYKIRKHIRTRLDMDAGFCAAGHGGALRLYADHYAEIDRCVREQSANEFDARSVKWRGYGLAAV